MDRDKWTLLTPNDLLTWRMENEFSRRQVASYFRVSTGVIRSWERGESAPPEWLQDRMFTVICTGPPPPEITVPAGRRRRNRWSRINSNTLYLWRKALGLKQSEAAVILGVNQTSVSRWERNTCAPPVSMQSRLRAAIEGYDDGSFPEPTPVEPAPTTKSTTTEKESPMATPVPPESIAKRAHSLMERIDSLKLPERTNECRWGRHDDFIVVKSGVTGAHYLWSALDGQFFRTKNPKTSQIQSDSPKGVISEDRQWLFPLMSQLPEGKVVVQRYNPAAGSAPATAAPAVAAIVTPAANVVAIHGLVDLKPTIETEEQIIRKNKGKLVIRLDHLLNLLKLSATEIPANATCSVDTVVFSWPLPDEIVG